MSIRTTLLGVFVAASLAACKTVPQAPVALSHEKLGAQSGRVGVAMSEPKVDLYLPGAGCLLCMAAATMANGSLNAYSHTLKDDDLVQVKAEIVELLRKKGVDASVVDGPLAIGDLPSLSLGRDTSPRDFGSFSKRFDRLVVIDVRQLGFVRNYASYVPTSDPKATLQGAAYMVDLKTNALEWYAPLSVVKAAEGKWDEAPAFPGLTNAYYQVIEIGKDELKKPHAGWARWRSRSPSSRAARRPAPKVRRPRRPGPSPSCRTSRCSSMASWTWIAPATALTRCCIPRAGSACSGCWWVSLRMQRWRPARVRAKRPACRPRPTRFSSRIARPSQACDCARCSVPCWTRQRRRLECACGRWPRFRPASWWCRRRRASR
jgi:hypothetical protein